MILSYLTESVKFYILSSIPILLPGTCSLLKYLYNAALSTYRSTYLTKSCASLSTLFLSAHCSTGLFSMPIRLWSIDERRQDFIVIIDMPLFVGLLSVSSEYDPTAKSWADRRAPTRALQGNNGIVPCDCETEKKTSDQKPGEMDLTPPDTEMHQDDLQSGTAKHDKKMWEFFPVIRITRNQ